MQPQKSIPRQSMWKIISIFLINLVTIQRDRESYIWYSIQFCRCHYHKNLSAHLVGWKTVKIFIALIVAVFTYWLTYAWMRKKGTKQRSFDWKIDWLDTASSRLGFLKFSSRYKKEHKAWKNCCSWSRTRHFQIEFYWRKSYRLTESKEFFCNRNIFEKWIFTLVFFKIKILFEIFMSFKKISQSKFQTKSKKNIHFFWNFVVL